MTRIPDWRHDPESLWHSTRLGREEYVQRLIAALVTGEAKTAWNVPTRPTLRGGAFLREVHVSRFEGTPAVEPTFVDEFELPSRHDGERAGWPDHAVLWTDRLFLIELKTERRSHREGQLSHYLDLATHHHPARAVELLYVTPVMTVRGPEPMPAGTRYAHVSWTELRPLFLSIWEESPVDWERTVVRWLDRWLDEVEAGAPLPVRTDAISAEEPSVVPPTFESEQAALGADHDTPDDALQVAALVQADGRQRAVDAQVTSPDELETIRLHLREQLLAGPLVGGVAVTHVRPWIWSARTSGGRPLTDLGEATGYELRLSRYARRQAQVRDKRDPSDLDGGLGPPSSS